MKYYNNQQLLCNVDETNPQNITTVGQVHNKLWEEKTIIVVDTPEHFELASVQDGSTGLIIVDDGNLIDTTKEIELSTVNSKLLESDTHPYSIGEYVKLVNEVSHKETIEEEIYARKNSIPEGTELMSISEWNEYYDNLEITANGYVKDTTTP